MEMSADGEGGCVCIFGSIVCLVECTPSSLTKILNNTSLLDYNIKVNLAQR